MQYAAEESKWRLTFAADSAEADRLCGLIHAEHLQGSSSGSQHLQVHSAVPSTPDMMGASAWGVEQLQGSSSGSQQLQVHSAVPSTPDRVAASALGLQGSSSGSQHLQVHSAVPSTPDRMGASTLGVCVKEAEKVNALLGGF